LDAVDPDLVEAWLTARSISRGLPWPVADHGGLRVDSAQPEEKSRYIFVEPVEGLRQLGEEIDEPFVALKLCRPASELMRILPDRWQLASDHFMLVWDSPSQPAPLPNPYALAVQMGGRVAVATIRDPAGALAASGRAVEHDGVFIFDQIRTEEAHRRRGLGSALMGALLTARTSAASRLILTATDEGRALYHRLGWRDYCHWSTALIPAV
jgi:GNAT superfamily N-acetyltransferase